MSRQQNLSLDEFVTAPRKQTPKPIQPLTSSNAFAFASSEHLSPRSESPTAVEEADEPAHLQQEARKALRQVKRERMKGSYNFVNVNLDRETKRRLKLASFTAETTMQSIMETAIKKYLDESGF